jgi:hypothetical protein
MTAFEPSHEAHRHQEVCRHVHAVYLSGIKPDWGHTMNWDQIAGNWKRFVGKAREK